MITLLAGSNLVSTDAAVGAIGVLLVVLLVAIIADRFGA